MYTPYEVCREDIAFQKREIDYNKIKIVPFIINHWFLCQSNCHQACSTILVCSKKVREKSRKCLNHKAQPFPDTMRKRKQTKPNKHKSNKRTKRTNSLFPKRGNRNVKRTEKHKNKIMPPVSFYSTFLKHIQTALSPVLWYSFKSL